MGGGKKTPTVRESSTDRTARLQREQKQQIDERQIRLRAARNRNGRTASSLYGASEAASLLGAGL